MIVCLEKKNPFSTTFERYRVYKIQHYTGKKTALSANSREKKIITVILRDELLLTYADYDKERAAIYPFSGIDDSP